MRAAVGQHVMPLQDLMKHDPVDKPAQPHAEQEPRRSQPAAVGANRVRHDRPSPSPMPVMRAASVAHRKLRNGTASAWRVLGEFSQDG